MPYVTSATEKTTGSGNSNETRALFYLMGQDADRDEMTCFVIDVFNDVVGSTGTFERLWDVQSKNARSGPKILGEELVTLFKNYMSEFSPYFVRRILFVGSVTNTVRNDDSMLSFSYSDIKDSSKSKVVEGLKAELKAKTYIVDDWITDENISSFLETVEFVVADGDKASYVKPLVGPVEETIVSDDKLEAIFNEVRKIQADKKNISSEGMTMNHPFESTATGKFLTRKNIEQLILARLINGNPFEGGVPLAFIPVYSNYPPEMRDEMLESCQNDLALQLFDKNAKEAFWSLFGDIVSVLTTSPCITTDEAYRRIDTDILERCIHLNPLSTQYFISKVMEGLKR